MFIFLNVCTFVLVVVICALDGGTRNERHLCAAQGFEVVVRYLSFGSSVYHGSETPCHHAEVIKLLHSLNLQIRHSSSLVSL